MKILPQTPTRGYVHIPHLRQKLDLLYGIHSYIDQQYKLAGALGISRAQLNTWLNGRRKKAGGVVVVVNQDSIRAKYYGKFLGLWELPRSVIELDDLRDFAKALESVEEQRRSSWDKLMCDVVETESIEIVANVERGLIDPDDVAHSAIPKFKYDDEILIRVGNHGFQHAIMLLQDKSGWSCLRPTVHNRETAIGDTVVFPRQVRKGAPRFAPIDMVGMHRVIAIFMNQPPSTAIVDILLKRPVDLEALNRVAAMLKKLFAESGTAKTSQHKVLGRQFLVVPRRA